MPFLKNKDSKSTGVIVQDRAVDQPPEMPEEDQGNPAAEAQADMLIHAIHSQDPKMVVEAMQNLMDAIQAPSEPEPESFDAQNMLAGESDV